MGFDASENDDVGGQEKEGESQEKSDINVGKDGAEYRNVDENADRYDDESVNGRMDGAEIEGAGWCEMNGDEAGR